MADNPTDSLELKISAQANSAEASLDRLVRKLDALTTSLGKVQTQGITNLANSVNQLANSMQAMNAIKTTDFTRLTKNLNRLSSSNTAQLYNISKALNQMVN